MKRNHVIFKRIPAALYEKRHDHGTDYDWDEHPIDTAESKVVSSIFSSSFLPKSNNQTLTV